MRSYLMVLLVYVISFFTSEKVGAQTCASQNDCFNIAMEFYHNRDNFKGYDRKAEKFFIKACNLGHASACDYAGWGIDRKSSSSMSITTETQAYYYKRGCELGDANSCYNYACFLNLRQRQVGAIEYLKSAASFGYLKQENALQDSDLKTIDREILKRIFKK